MAYQQRFVIEKTAEGKIKGGKAIRSAIDDLSQGRWVFTLTKYKKQRSLAQNSYYHACVIPAVKDGLIDMGFDRHLLTSENVHEILKGKFLKQEIEGEFSGEYIEITKSTSDLSTSEFMDYIAQIQKWGAEFLHVYIPDPNEQSTLNFE